MRLLAIAIILGITSSASFGQAAKKQREEDFLKEKPLVGDSLPDLTVYDVRGKEVKTSSLRGHYTVLTFGCLT
jgi:cytochrome oxidase Cu insertion factor (SCO1/SenC/PrrC family)